VKKPNAVGKTLAVVKTIKQYKVTAGEVGGASTALSKITYK